MLAGPGGRSVTPVLLDQPRISTAVLMVESSWNRFLLHPSPALLPHVPGF
jgi:hypothetical protein